jgi:hypothetical protein
MNEKRDAVQPDRLSLKRWSRRKLEAARAQTAQAREPAASTEAPLAPSQQVSQPVERVTPDRTPALPPIESLTIDSEFAAFFKPEIPEATQRAALKQLFRDPRFNIMDGLDVYIDDYTQSDPIPPEMMKQLLHTRHIFNPPKTEVNAEGHVVDVVEPVEQAEREESPDAAAATAISDGTGDATPESLSRAIEDSAEPAKVRQGEPQGGMKS